MQQGLDTVFIGTPHEVATTRMWILPPAELQIKHIDRLEIERGYLYIKSDGEQSYIEMRRTDENTQYIGGTIDPQGQRRQELIEEAIFNSLWPETAELRIHKSRLYVMSQGNIVMFTEFYTDDSWGLKTLTAKFGTPDTAKEFVLPDDFRGAREIKPDELTDIHLAKDPLCYTRFYREHIG